MKVQPTSEPRLPARSPAVEALEYLSLTNEQDFNRGQIIYSAAWPAPALYLVIDGLVKVSRPTLDEPAVIDLYHAGDFFGMGVLHAKAKEGEQAVAMEPTTLMAWPREDLQKQLAKHPRLTVLLMEISAERLENAHRRIASLHSDEVSDRLNLALMHFAEVFGMPGPKDSVLIPISLTHKFLAQYVGTSREIVTNDLNALRREGLITYGRKGIRLTAAFRKAVAERSATAA